MRLICSVCDRPVGQNPATCPYCGGPLRERRIDRALRFLLPLAVVLSLGVAIADGAGQPGEVLWPREIPAACILALALAWAWLPLALPSTQPGIGSAARRAQAVRIGSRRLLFGAAIVVTGWLAGGRPTAPAIWLAVIALAACPRPWRLPAYPLLAGVLAAVARILAV
ncbi:MAG: hypothetical protein GX590_11850 [Lentisphaerae bacterium]|nr:hypothetical protein [Lentisphaerota bacterium]